MLSDSLHALLQTKAALPASFLEGAWNLASARGNTTMLVSLISRADLPAHLVEQAAGMRDAQARAAYLMRPSTTAVERKRLLSQETRIAVLSDVLQAGMAVQGDFAEIVSQRIAAKPTIGLAKAIIATPGPVPAMLAARALAIAGHRDDLTHAQQVGTKTRIQEVVKDPWAASTLIRALPVGHLGNSVILRVLSAHGVDAAARLHAVHSHLAWAVTKRPSSGRDMHRWDRLIVNIVDALSGAPDLQDEVLAEMRAILASLGPHAAQARVASYTRTTAPARLQEVPVLEQASTTTDPEDLALMARSRDPEVMRALAGNPALGPDLQVMVADTMASVDAQMAEDALRLFAGNEAAADAVYAARPSIWEADQWRSFADQDAAKARLVDHVAQAKFMTASTVDEVVSAVGPAHPAVARLPWVVVERYLHRYHRNPNDPRSPLADALVHALQSSLTTCESWQAAEALSSGFTGSLSDLVGAAARL